MNPTSLNNELNMHQTDSIYSDNNQDLPTTRPDPSLTEQIPSPYQITAHLLHLATQAERLELQLQGLLGQVKQSGVQLDVLTRRAGDGASIEAMEEQVADVVTRLDGHQEQLEGSIGVVAQQVAELVTRLESHQEQLKGMVKTIKKQSRTQFKANTLAESQQKRIEKTLATLQELITRRDEAQKVDVLPEKPRLQEARGEARREMAAELLPALDGLENAIDNGRSLVERRQQESAQAEAQVDAQVEAANQKALKQTETRPVADDQSSESDASFWGRLNYAFGGDLPEPVQTKTEVIYKTVEVKVKVPPPSEEPLIAWLDGLELVRERFLSLLLTEDVEPILALNQPFDPRLHVALEAVERDDVPPGTVVHVIRKGYRQEGRILRYAEVAVSKAIQEQ
ncbi:MAG: nucleotide exchange factor GrpE [Ardenticatenaceae bacterium]